MKKKIYELDSLSEKIYGHSDLRKTFDLYLQDKICSYCRKEARFITTCKDYGEFRCEKHKGLPFLFKRGNENPSYRKLENQSEVLH